MSITEDKSGNLWFGTSGGVSRYDGKSFTTFTTAQGLADNSVTSITEDKSGNLWFGTYGGVSRYDGKSFATFTTAQGLANNSVMSITEDKSGNLWFGTYGGGVSVLRRVAVSEGELRGKNEISYKFLTINSTDGLPDNNICAIREDKQGNIIIGTNFGLAVLPADEAKRIVTTFTEGKLRSLEIYNQFTGYPVRDVNTGQDNGAMHVDSKGTIWVGHGNNGVTAVDLEAVHKNMKPPVVVIEKVKINEENICWYSARTGEIDSLTLVQQEILTYGKVLAQAERDTLRQEWAGIDFDGITRFYPMPENLVLPYKHNHLTFEYNAIETGRHFLVNYQYMLEGQDETWSPITKKTDVSYGNLYEGEYTLLLKAQSPWGVWSEPAAYGFTVLPPWYRTWWMYAVYGFGAIGFVVLIVWWNGRRLRARAKELTEEVHKATKVIREQKEKVEKQKEERERMMQEIHHRVKNNMQIVKSLLGLQAGKIDDKKTKDMFKECQSRITAMATIHENMYQSEELISIDIDHYLKVIVEKIAYSYQMDKEITYNLNIPTIKFGSRTLVPLGLIINEIITNSYKYAFKDRESGEITLEVKEINNNEYQLIIGDNGIGMPMDFVHEESNSLGTELVHIFTEQLEGSIERIKQAGTMFKITFIPQDD